MWWKSISGHSSDVTERCDYRLGFIFRPRDFIYSMYLTARSDLLLIAEFFFTVFVCSTSLCQTRKKSFIMSRWLEVSIGEEHVTRFITSEERTFYTSRIYLPLAVREIHNTSVTGALKIKI